MLTAILWTLAVLVVLGGLALLVAALFTRSVARKVEAALPPAGRFTDVPGGRIHWVEKGEGEPVVLIHGLAGNLNNFGYGLIDNLARDFRVIAIDRPGCGWSRRDSDDGARIPEQARMIAAMLEAEGVGPAVLVGHSLGGAVSLALAQNHPERVRSLALVSALVQAPRATSEAFSGLQIGNPGLRRLVANTVAVPMSIRHADRTLAIVFGPDAVPADFRTRGGGMLGLRPDAFYAASTDLAAIPMDMDEITARLDRIQVPVGLFYGMDDQLLPAADQIAALRRALPEADVETVEHRGHMPIVTDPERVEAFVRRMAGS